jgi:serine protease Do
MKHICVFAAIIATLAISANTLSASSDFGNLELEKLRNWARGVEESARKWVDELLEDNESLEKQEQAYLGILVDSVPNVLRDHIDLPAGVGLLVSKVQPDSPAMKAGIEPNDILLLFNSQLIINHQQLIVLIGLENLPSEAGVTVLRRGEKREFRVQLSAPITQDNESSVGDGDKSNS